MTCDDFVDYIYCYAFERRIFFSPEWLINRLTQSRKDENCCQLEVLVRWKLGKTFAVEIDAKRAWTKKNEKERKMNWSGIKGKSNLKFFLRQTSFHALAFRCKLSQWRIHISFRLRHKNAPSRCYCCYLSLFSLFPTWMLGIVVALQQKVQKLFRVELKISRKKKSECFVAVQYDRFIFVSGRINIRNLRIKT